MHSSKHIQYYQKCFEADKGRNSLWNILTKDIEFLSFVEPQLIARTVAQLIKSNETYTSVIPAHLARQIDATMSTYRREKKLLQCSTLFVGKADLSSFGGVRNGTICAPLRIADAEVVIDDDNASIHCYRDSFRWNYNLLYWLLGSRENSEAFEDSVDIASPNLCEDVFAYLKKQLKNNTLQRAAVDSKKECESLSSLASNSDWYLCPSELVFITSRSVSARGVIDELIQLGKDLPTPKLMHRVFSPVRDAADQAKKAITPLYTPGSLSQAQKNALNSCSRHRLTVLQGPPGTGKSYTIAAIAMEHCLRGESVLVVSNNDHAVDVIRNKLLDDFGLEDISLVRGGTHEYLKVLKSRIDKMLRDFLKEDDAKLQHGNFKKSNRQLRKRREEYETLAEKELRLANMLTATDLGMLGKILRKIKIYSSKKRISQKQLLSEVWGAVDSAKHARDEQLKVWKRSFLSAKRYRCLKKRRESIERFRSALGARNSLTQQKRFAAMDFDIIVEAMPVWLCSLDSLHRALPLQAEIFDLVIFDEASQCDIASSLPALFRAKRALVVGDRQQLRHVSFLSRQRQALILEKLRANEGEGEAMEVASYRDVSVLDFVEQFSALDGENLMLTEHFRSAPDIIAYSNQHFYNSKLRIMKANPCSDRISSTQTVLVEGGQRKGGVNREEAKQLILELRSIVDEQALLNKESRLSVGVLSFFREQSELLENEIVRLFSAEEIKQHRLRAGTPYSFQGEERDIMLISCVVDKDTAANVYTYLNRAEVFNVAITRAKQLQCLFISADCEDLNKNSRLHSYLRSIVKDRRPVYEGSAEISAITQDFVVSLGAEDIQCFTNYPLAGISVDVVASFKNAVLAIDLVGFPDTFKNHLDLEASRCLQRAGIAIVPVSLHEWLSAKTQVMETLAAVFAELRKKNTLKELSLVNLAQHWVKLISKRPQFADKVKELEEALLAQHLSEEHLLLGELINQYGRTLWILDEKLSPSEITHMRHSASADEVLLASFENFDQIVAAKRALFSTEGERFSKASARNNAEEEARQLRGSLVEQVNSAIAALRDMSLNWAKVKTRSKFHGGEIEAALEDLNRLTTNVDRYNSHH